VNGALTEVKMSRIRKRSEVDQEKKTYQSGDRVTVLGLECKNDQTSETASAGRRGQTGETGDSQPT
jgi:hypothetical protein